MARGRLEARLDRRLQRRYRSPRNRRLVSCGRAAQAEQYLAELESKWKSYPSVSQMGRRNWTRITPSFNDPPDVRKAIYTPNSMESLNR